MNMWKAALPVALFLAPASQAQAPAADAELKAAVEKYDRAVAGKDLSAVRSLLAPGVLLYEHSVRNSGIDDVFDNHLKPEIAEFEDMRMEFSDARLESGSDLGLVTRQYQLQGKLRGRQINAKGNETMVWRKIGGVWKIIHIHYSHPCPRPPSPAE